MIIHHQLCCSKQKHRYKRLLCPRLAWPGVREGWGGVGEGRVGRGSGAACRFMIARLYDVYGGKTIVMMEAFCVVNAFYGVASRCYRRAIIPAPNLNIYRPCWLAARFKDEPQRVDSGPESYKNMVMAWRRRDVGKRCQSGQRY